MQVRLACEIELGIKLDKKASSFCTNTKGLHNLHCGRHPCATVTYIPGGIEA